MAVATARKPKAPSKRLGTLREDYSRSPGVRLDEAAGILYDCKLCGLQSDNGRDYLPEALKAAIPLYEGKPCYLNHRRKGEQRDANDDIGIWHNVRFVENVGLVGDLKFELHAPYTPRLIDRAKRIQENVGFSHDADGDTELRNGRPTVTKINEVISVDLVAGPATANGLFEGKTMNVRQLLESVKTTKARQAWLTRLLEDDSMAAIADAPAEAPADPKDAMAEAFRTGLHACVDAYVDGKIDLAGFLVQIKDFAKTHDKMTAEPEPEAPAAEQDGEQSGEDDKKQEACEPDDKKQEQRIAALEKANAELKEEKAINQLCKTLGFTPNDKQFATLLEAKSPKVRQELAEAYKLASKTGGFTRSNGFKEQSAPTKGWKESILN